MDHWPVKVLPRESQDFMTWGCEGCTQMFQTKREFNKHFLAELRLLLSSVSKDGPIPVGVREVKLPPLDETSQDDCITRLRKWVNTLTGSPRVSIEADILSLCDDYETLAANRKRLVEETRKLVEIASLWVRVDDHTYCHDDVPGGCVVLELRNAVDTVADILLKE